MPFYTFMFFMPLLFPKKFPYIEYRFERSRLQRVLIFAGSLESANSSILAACRLFKEVVGKKSGFYVNEVVQFH